MVQLLGFVRLATVPPAPQLSTLGDGSPRSVSEQREDHEDMRAAYKEYACDILRVMIDEMNKPKASN